MILAVHDLVAGYGAGAVIHGVSIEVDAAEVVCLLGRNGAGKSTTLRTIMGLTPPRSGRVAFMDQGDIGPARRSTSRGSASVSSRTTGASSWT